MKLLITGVSGFLGEEIVTYFLSKQYNIMGIDKDPILYKNKINFIKCDISKDFDLLEKEILHFKPSVIIHCAAEMLDTYNEGKLFNTNVLGSKKLVEISKKAKVKKFIFISTFSIFEKNYSNLVSENEPPSFKNKYGKSKWLAENAIKNVNYAGDMIIIRCPVILGKKRSYRLSVLFDFIIENNNIPYIGDGKNRLSFIHASDICIAINLLLEVKGNYTINISTDDHPSMREIILHLIKISGSKSKIIFFNKLLGNFLLSFAVFFKLLPFTSYHKKFFNCNVVLNNNKLKSLINWEPTYNTIRMFEENFNYYKLYKNTDNDDVSWSKKKANTGILKIIKKII